MNEPFLGPVPAGSHPGDLCCPSTPSFLLPQLDPPELRKQRNLSLNLALRVTSPWASHFTFQVSHLQNENSIGMCFVGLLKGCGLLGSDPAMSPTACLLPGALV